MIRLPGDSDSLEAITRRAATPHALLARARDSIVRSTTASQHRQVRPLAVPYGVLRQRPRRAVPDAKHTLTKWSAPAGHERLRVRGLRLYGLAWQHAPQRALSYWRSQSVVKYLTQIGGVPLRDIATPAGYAETSRSPRTPRPVAAR